MNAKERVKQIIRDCCAGNASLATDLLHEEFVIIHRDELPKSEVIDRDGKAHVDIGAEWGTWAVSHEEPIKRAAMEYVSAWLTAKEWNSKQAVLARKLEAEAYALYVASCEATNTLPAPTWEVAKELGEGSVGRDFLAIARRARELHLPQKKGEF